VAPWKRARNEPLVRTTIAPTSSRRGVKENVPPVDGARRRELRILPGDTIAGVISHVVAVIADDQVKVTKLERTLSEPATLASTNGPGFKAIESMVHAYFPMRIPCPASSTARPIRGISSPWLPTTIVSCPAPS